MNLLAIPIPPGGEGLTTGITLGTCLLDGSGSPLDLGPEATLVLNACTVPTTGGVDRQAMILTSQRLYSRHPDLSDISIVTAMSDGRTVRCGTVRSLNGTQLMPYGRQLYPPVTSCVGSPLLTDLRGLPVTPSPETVAALEGCIDCRGIVSGTKLRAVAGPILDSNPALRHVSIATLTDHGVSARWCVGRRFPGSALETHALCRLAGLSSEGVLVASEIFHAPVPSHNFTDLPGFPIPAPWTDGPYGRGYLPVPGPFPWLDTLDLELPGA